MEQRVVGIGGLGAAQPVWRGIAGRTFKGGQLVVQQPRQRLSCFDARVDQECAGLLLSQPLSSIVHNKTGGIALFVTRFLKSLNEEGLLWFNLSSRRW